MSWDGNFWQEGTQMKFLTYIRVEDGIRYCSTYAVSLQAIAEKKLFNKILLFYISTEIISLNSFCAGFSSRNFIFWQLLNYVDTQYTFNIY